jgi:hypothetical protein
VGAADDDEAQAEAEAEAEKKAELWGGRLDIPGLVHIGNVGACP